MCLTFSFFFFFTPPYDKRLNWTAEKYRKINDGCQRQKGETVLFCFLCSTLSFFCTIKVILTELIVPVCCIIKQTVD